MSFRTIINQNEIQEPIKKIDYQSKIGLVGSCFVGNIGEKLSYFKFDNFVNPHGILFNPKAIETALSDIIQQKVYTKSDLVFENERWHSLHHHSDFSNSDSLQVLKIINKKIKKYHQTLNETTHLILTLGTAWAYHHIETDQLVANCHKIPQKNFIKRILSVDEIYKSLQNSIQMVQKLNPTIQIILTLSPVRHLKDGMLDDNRSKAHLLSAIHQVVTDSKVSYFPSYEIIMDDLRDYRFYASDMIHPNQTAIDYVWDIFKSIWIDSNTHTTMKEVAYIQKGLNHSVFNPNSVQYIKFIEKINKKKEVLFNEYAISF
jgi:hypothetical protein